MKHQQPGRLIIPPRRLYVPRMSAARAAYHADLRRYRDQGEPLPVDTYVNLLLW